MAESEIVVQGASEVRVMPDSASVRVKVDGDGESQEEAYEAAREPARAIDAVLEAHAAALGRVVTAGLSVQPKSRWRKGESIRVGWRASRSTHVEIAALDEVGALVAGLAQAGGAVTGPWWHLEPGNAAHDAVRTAAAEDARRRADTYAEGLGLVVGAVAWIAEPGLRSPSTRGAWADYPSVAGALAGAADDDEPISVSPQPITLTAAVEVGFELALPRPE